MIEDSQDLSDQMLRSLFLYILGGISGKLSSDSEFSDNLNEKIRESWLQSGCMLISQISRRVTLSKTILTSLLVTLTQRIRSKIDVTGSGYISGLEYESIDLLDHSIENILMAVVIIIRHQRVKISSSILKTMFVDDHPPYGTNFIVLRCLENLRMRYYFCSSLIIGHRHNADISTTLGAILQGIARELFQLDACSFDQTESRNYLLEIYKNVVSSGQVESSLVMLSLKTLLSNYIQSSVNYQDSTKSFEKNIFDIVCELLRFIAQRYSLEFDKTIKSVLDDESTAEFQQLLNSAFHHAVYHKIQDNGTGLFLSLNDSSEIIRREGLQLFGSIFGTSNIELNGEGKDNKEMSDLAQSVFNLFETDLYNNQTMLLMFNVNTLVPLFKLLPDKVEEIIDKVPLILLHLWHRLHIDSTSSGVIISLLQSLYHQESLRTLFSVDHVKEALNDRLFGILLIVLSMTKSRHDPLFKIYDSFAIALQNLSLFHPVFDNKSVVLPTESTPYLQGIFLLCQKLMFNIQKNYKSCFTFLNRSYSTIHRYLALISDENIKQENLSSIYEESLLTLLDLSTSMCERMISDSKSRDTIVVILSLSMSWINFNYTRKICGYVSTKTTFLSLNTTLLKLFHIWKQVNLIPAKILSYHRLEDCLQGYINTSQSQSLSYRLLLTLLHLISYEDDVAEIASLLKTCLETFYPTDHISILISIASADIELQSLSQNSSIHTDINSEFEILYCDEHKDLFVSNLRIGPTQAKVSLSPTSQLSAVDTLSSYINQLNPLSDVCMVSLLPLIISNFQVENIEIQHATLELLNTVVNQFQNQSSLNSLIKGKHVIPSAAIKFYFSNLSSTLLKTPHNKSIFIHALQHSLISSPEVIELLWEIISLFHWNLPKLSSHLFLIATHQQSYKNIWNCSKRLLDSVPASSIVDNSSGLLAQLIVRTTNQAYLEHHDDSKKNTSQIHDLTKSYLQFLHDCEDRTLGSIICREILSSISRTSQEKIWVDHLPLGDREALFVEMMEKLQKNSHADYFTPLCAIVVSIDLGFTYLQQAFETIRDSFKKYSVVSERNSYDHLLSDSVEMNQSLPLGQKLVATLSIPMQKLSLTIEIVGALYRQLLGNENEINLDHPHHDTLSQSCVVLFDLLNILNTHQIKKILSVNYLRNNILELLCFVLCKIKVQTDSSKSKSATQYSIERIQSDICIVFKCLELSATLDIQKHSLNVLRHLLVLSPSHIHPTVLLLTKILSANILSNSISYENANNLVSNILKAIISISDHGKSIALPQDILEPYFQTFQTISTQRRIALLNIISERYDVAIVPICISLLLSHVFIAYSRFDDSQEHPIDEGKEVFILLSRSAHRKANRMMRTSQSEEFFNLAVNYNLQSTNALNQIGCLIMLTNIVSKLFTLCVGSDNQPTVLIEYSGGSSKYHFSPTHYIKYTNSFFSKELEPSSNTPALIVLHLEYILEFIENSSFHDHLLSILFDNSSGSLTSFGREVQKLFLSFSESILELLSHLTYLQHHYSNKKNSSVFAISLKHQNVCLSSKEFLKYSSSLCLSIMHSLQNLLDGPTFIVILQELLSHENIAVRQKSLEILSDRLQTLDRRRAKLDVRSRIYTIFNFLRRIYIWICRRAFVGQL